MHKRPLQASGSRLVLVRGKVALVVIGKTDQARSRLGQVLAEGAEPVPKDGAHARVPAIGGFESVLARTSRRFRETHVAVSQICRLALEPATASVVGSSGQKEAENTLPWNSEKRSNGQIDAAQGTQWKEERTTPRSRAVTRLMLRFSPSC